MSAIIPCLFGTTRGFEMLELVHLNFKVKDLLVAITHAEVELGLDDPCVKILRIKEENRTHTWVGLYRKAYEMGFSREGGYYGAGVWLSDATVNARQIMDALEDLCQQIRRLALQDRKFQRTLADIEPQLVASPALNALLKGTPTPVRGGISADAKTCAFITQTQAVQDIINWAQTDAMAHNFQSIIVAPASAFPKAGASASITQYADLAAVERALERDYTARVAKSDALARDWQRKAQSLEAEASARNSELQVLKQKNSQLAAEASRARLLVKPDRRGHSVDEDKPSLPWKILAASTVLLSLALAWFSFDEWSDARTAASVASQKIGKLEADLQGTQDQLKDAKNRNSQLDQKLKWAMDELEFARSNSGTASNKPDASGNEGASSVEDLEPQVAKPRLICTPRCLPLTGGNGPSPSEQAQMKNLSEQAGNAPPEPSEEVSLTKNEEKFFMRILKEIQSKPLEVGSSLVNNQIKASPKELTRIISWLAQNEYIKKTEANGVTVWTITVTGDAQLKKRKN